MPQSQWTWKICHFSTFLNIGQNSSRVVLQIFNPETIIWQRVKEFPKTVIVRKDEL